MRSLILPVVLACQMLFAGSLFSQMTSPPIIPPTDPNQNQVNPLTNPGNPISNPGVPAQSNPVNPGQPAVPMNPSQPSPATNPAQSGNAPINTGIDNSGMPTQPSTAPVSPAYSTPSQTVVPPRMPDDSILSPKPLSPQRKEH